MSWPERVWSCELQALLTHYMGEGETVASVTVEGTAISHSPNVLLLTPKCQLQCQERALKPIAPPPQDTVGDAYVRSINDLVPQLKSQDPEENKTICQRQSQLNTRPVPDLAGLEASRWAGGHLKLHISPPPFGQVDKFP